MHNALLDLRRGVAGGNRFVKTGQVVHAGDQNILHAAIAQLIQNTKPEVVSRILRTFADGVPRRFQLASATVSS